MASAWPISLSRPLSQLLCSPFWGPRGSQGIPHILALVETSQQPFQEEAPQGREVEGASSSFPVQLPNQPSAFLQPPGYFEHTPTSYATHAPASAGSHHLSATPSHSGEGSLPALRPSFILNDSSIHTRPISTSPPRLQTSLSPLHRLPTPSHTLDLGLTTDSPIPEFPPGPYLLSFQLTFSQAGFF